MSIPTQLTSIVGQWGSKNRLWFSPEDPAHESDGTALVVPVAQGRFLTIQYTWAFDGAPQDGLLLIGCESGAEAVKAVWVDSFHMQDQSMACAGIVNADGGILLKGNYAAPPDENWGWWINVQATGDDAFQIVMHNVTPQGQALLAVESIYTRQ